MLPRLKKRAEFLTVSRSGLKVITRGVIIQALFRESGPLRLGFTVSNKTAGGSVPRNRIKRRLKAAAEAALSAHATLAADFVLIGRAEALTRDFTELKGDISYAIKKMLTKKC